MSDRQVVLDTETTGLSAADGHRIIEIGCVEMINRRLTGRTLHQYINPQRDIDEGAMQVHGLTPEMLADKPLFEQIADEFLSFIEGAELLIHNAPFDISFLDAELKRIKRSPVSKCCEEVTDGAHPQDGHDDGSWQQESCVADHPPGPATCPSEGR